MRGHYLLHQRRQVSTTNSSAKKIILGISVQAETERTQRVNCIRYTRSEFEGRDLKVPVVEDASGQKYAFAELPLKLSEADRPMMCDPTGTKYQWLLLILDNGSPSGHNSITRSSRLTRSGCIPGLLFERWKQNGSQVVAEPDETICSCNLTRSLIYFQSSLPFLLGVHL